MELKFISVFAGCGGSSLGYKMAGYKELLAIEWEQNAVDVFNLNFSDIHIWQRDIKKVTGKEILKFCNLKKGELDLLDGSPPCQGFSTAGKRKVTDPRNDLFVEYVRLIEDLQPKVFVMENVSGLIKGTMKGKFIKIMKVLKNLDYNVKCKLMNTMHYNVPQSRRRLIFIGIRKDLNKIPSFPEGSKKIITVKKAFEGVQNSTFAKINKEKKAFQVIKKMKQGDSVQDIIGKFGYDTSRLINNAVAGVVKKSLGSFALGFVHPLEDRTITIEECKRLQSFPDNFIFKGSFKEQWSRIGNSVPPKFMYVIAKHIKETIFS